MSSNVLNMCSDMDQIFVSFEGDVFSVIFYDSSLQTHWRVKTTDSQRLVKMVLKRRDFYVLVSFLFF